MNQEGKPIVKCESSEDYVETFHTIPARLQGWLLLHFKVPRILLPSLSRTYSLMNYYWMEEISAIGMMVDPKCVIRKHLSVGVENRDEQEMNFKCKEIGWLHPFRSWDDLWLSSLCKVSSTLKGFAKSKKISRPWHKSFTCSWIWV